MAASERPFYTRKEGVVSYKVVDVVPDTDAWLEERRSSVGASEVAAVVGMSEYATPLDVYKSKHGFDKPFDPLISLVGHADEPTMSLWLTKLSGLEPDLSDGFMARSVEWPFLHATPDRMWGDIPVQLKTAHEWTSHKWDEGIPKAYRVQVQAEMAVLGAPRALLVVRIGLRDFRAIWEPRDDRFINEHMISMLAEFWEGVTGGVPPDPTTREEIAEAWPDEGGVMDAPEIALEWIEKRAFLLAEMREAKAEADAIQEKLGLYMLDAGVDTFTHQGQKLLTYKKQKGRASFDAAALKRDRPDLVVEYTKQGADFMVMRTMKPKEK